MLRNFGMRFTLLALELSRKLRSRGHEKSNYEWVLPFLREKHNCKQFVEIGSRDALDAIFLSRALSSTGVAFECVPWNFEVCRNNINDSGLSGLVVDDRCLSDVSEALLFNAIDPSKYNNPGAGSVFELDFTSRPTGDSDRNLSRVQNTIVVEAVRFDETGYDIPHSIFMDAQGAELLVLKGFGEGLNSVTNIVFETALLPTYRSAANFWDLYEFLTLAGFKYVLSNKYGIKLPPTALPEKFDGEFDCLFSKGN